MLAFIDPDKVGADAHHQINESIIGVGAGRFLGVGFGEGQQKFHLPYAYSDFLFSTIAEEWGFIGVCLVVLLFSLFCWLGFRIARTAADTFGQYLAVGLTERRGAHGVPAHGGVARADADHRPHAAVHVVRAVEPGHLARRRGHPDQRRADAREAGTRKSVNVNGNSERARSPVHRFRYRSRG